MSGTRRKFFQDAAAFSAGIFGLGAQLNAQTQAPPHEHAAHAARGSHHAPVDVAAGPPMITPDVPDLRYEMDGAVKVFKLTSEVVKRKIAPFKTIDAWGYNGSCPGPTIQIQQGDRVRVIFENRLPESTTVHWHGLEIPIEQDGVPWISQKPIAARRKIHLRVHRPSGRHVLLSRAQRHAGNDGADRIVHRPSRKTVQAARRSRLRESFCRSGPCCPATPCRTPPAWNSTG